MLELRLFFVLALMLLIPGWFALALTGIWKRWPGLQSWLLAIGIGISFYPVFFYASRFFLPWLTFGPYKMSALLLGMLVVAMWLLRKDGAWLSRLDLFEWIAVIVFAVTIFTRFWIIRDQPFPAWSDSVHHSILTQLTAVRGQLPYSLEPYFPIPLDQYHLGIYSLSATLQWIAQAPAHTALLWTAQMLNALCGIGVYLVLDRKVGRVGAIAGAVAASLLLSQPALYVNWGRFTQMSSQVILLVGWLLVWEALLSWRSAEGFRRRELIGYTGLAAMSTASIFLLHFRVAAFYLPLIALICLWLLWSSRKDKASIARVVGGIVGVGVMSLLLVGPVLVDALQVYTGSRAIQTSVRAASSVQVGTVNFFEFTFSSFPYLIGGPSWFLWLSTGALLVGVILRKKLVIACLFWVLSLFGLGYAYLLQIPVLNLTNLGAILIMLYLPIGLVIGSLAQEIVAVFRSDRCVAYGVSIFFLGAGMAAAPARATTVEAYRYFVTPADVAAMDWIKANTPPDALFAVNTYFWLSWAPHGTDAGYWIPYFTQRRTTASVMIFSSLADSEHRAEVVTASQQIELLESDPGSLAALAETGVDYIYIGQRGDFASPGLQADILREQEAVEEVYTNEGVSLFRLTPP
ncbi:hypothetical protein GC175_05810 [bacterium]|nr:hypothetical protein [bacterium]